MPQQVPKPMCMRKGIQFLTRGPGFPAAGQVIVAALAVHLAALALTLLLALLACVLADRRDRRVASLDDLRSLVGADWVAAMPATQPVQRPSPAGSAATRSSRLRSAIRPLLSPVMLWRRSRSVLRK